ncbi:MAG: energy-coupling factor ABC transporter ATP-binding protein [Planctomycetota bacterium]
MTHHLVEVRDLSFSYPDGTEALRGVSFRIRHGDSLGVIGANGAGKSTLLLHLNGCLAPSRGEVRIGDIPITPGTLPGVRRTVGMIFQDPDDQLFMPTVAEDVAFGPMNFGLPPEDVERRVSQALERIGIAHLRDRPPYRLSAGEKRGAAIATVLAMEPSILVADEPSSYLDPRGRRRLIQLLKSFDHTRIIATHDLELVVEVCTSVILMDRGKVVAEGATAEILADEALLLEHGLERPHSLGHRHPN